VINQRDVVLIPVPFSNLTNSKPRPVIVISNDNYNKKFDDFISIAMTSQKLVSRDHILPITNKDMEQGKLVVDSIAKVDMIHILHQTLVIHKIGKIRVNTHKILKNLLLKVL
jgi:mRNA-degrading endonuclease toxin of MazEF toxin-antitoxin module